MSSSQIRAHLPGWLDRFRPRSVVFLAGVNNTWNHAAAGGDHASVARWYSKLRTHRLVSLLLLNLTDRRLVDAEAPTGRPEIARTQIDEGRGGEEYRDRRSGEVLIKHVSDTGRRLEIAQVVESLGRDLKVVQELARTRGARLLLLTYAPDFWIHQQVNEAIRQFGRDHDVVVVDVNARFRTLLAGGGPRSQYFLTETEGHPNVQGYSHVAALVAEAVLAAPSLESP
jgi:hypothetical protein